MTTVTKSSTRESQPQRSQQPQPRQNIYDYDGEYEFTVARHWIARETLTQYRLDGEVFSVELAADPRRWP